jgi:hypothetical protein
MYNGSLKYKRMKAWGETAWRSAEGASLTANLSGKRTLAGRSSGESPRYGTTKGESLLKVNFQVSGQRIMPKEGSSVLFYVLFSMKAETLYEPQKKDF